MAEENLELEVIERVARQLYGEYEPFGVGFDKATDTEKWFYTGMAERYVKTIAAAGFSLVEVKNDVGIVRRGGAPGSG